MDEKGAGSGWGLQKVWCQRHDGHHVDKGVLVRSGPAAGVVPET